MKSKALKLFGIFLILNSCADKESELLILEPNAFTEESISLSELSDDIKYIPLDNKITIGLYDRCKIVNGYIYLAVKDVGVCRYSMEGKFDRQYGSIGRGPGEFVYWLKYAVDKISGTVYVLDQIMDDVEVYNNKGMHLRTIKLSIDEDGFGFNDIEFFNSKLLLAQFLNMGKGDHDWIVLDTLGSRFTEKKNPYPEFNGSWGGNGGLYLCNDCLGYWDSYKDTIYTISKNFNSNPVGVFSFGQYKIPTDDAAYEASRYNNRVNYMITRLLFETDNFFVLRYSFERAQHLVIINKTNG